MLSTLKHIHRRRTDLLGHIDLRAGFAEWEESCVPSYCHKNWCAAFVSWQRLFRCVALAKRNRPHPRRILDFGSSVGELGHLVNEAGATYEFIEQDSAAASYLLSRLPGARQTTLEHCDSRAYDWIFAIDSLEHNENFGELLTAISQKLASGGVLVLSGPTESGLYRLGRRIAGFAGGYHKTNIYDIEQQARRILRQVDRATIFPGLCLFSLSAWQPLETTGVHHN